MSNDYDYLFKILIIGDSNVGKSCILMRFSDDCFTESHISTIGVDFKIRTIVNTDTDKKSKLQIWDTAGQERFRTITSSYYRGSNGILVVFDTTIINSFNNIPMWLEEIASYTTKKIPIILIGNKSDIETHRTVSYEEAKDFADSKGMMYIETSAKNGKNIEKTFFELTEQMTKLNITLPVLKGGTNTRIQNLNSFQPTNKTCC